MVAISAIDIAIWVMGKITKTYIQTSWWKN